MDTLFLYNTKTLKEKFKTKVFAGDNHITKINVQIPDNIGGYPKRECEYNLRAIIPEGNLSYMVEPSQPYFYITNDITEKAQTVKLMMIITHDGNVIGRTNTVDLIVNEPAEAPDPPLTPRSEFDEVIAEQRAEIAEQAETITTQDETITQQTERITELNGEVSTLEGTVAEQQVTITRQNTTIDELNHRVPPLQTLDPINPSQEQQTFNPQSPNIGFPQVVVNAPTAEGLNFDYADLRKDVEFLGGKGTYAPTYGTTKGGIYITETDEDGYATAIAIHNWNDKDASLKLPVSNLGKVRIRKVIFDGNTGFSKISDNAFKDWSSLSSFSIPDSVISIGSSAFENTVSMTSLTIPDSVISIGSRAFANTRIQNRIVLSSNITSLAGYIFSDSTVPYVEIRASVKTLPVGTFGTGNGFLAQASPLSVYVGEGITTLGKNAFYYRLGLWNLYLPATLTSIDPQAFTYCSRIRELTLGNGWNLSINVYNLTRDVSVDISFIISWLEALADRTGQTAYTLTIGTTNLNKLTAEQRNIATNKNWNLA